MLFRSHSIQSSVVTGRGNSLGCATQHVPDGYTTLTLWQFQESYSRELSAPLGLPDQRGFARPDSAFLVFWRATRDAGFGLAGTPFFKAGHGWTDRGVIGDRYFLANSVQPDQHARRLATRLDGRHLGFMGRPHVGNRGRFLAGSSLGPAVRFVFFLRRRFEERLVGNSC